MDREYLYKLVNGHFNKSDKTPTDKYLKLGRYITSVFIFVFIAAFFCTQSQATQILYPTSGYTSSCPGNDLPFPINGTVYDCMNNIIKSYSSTSATITGVNLEQCRPDLQRCHYCISGRYVYDIYYASCWSYYIYFNNPSDLCQDGSSFIFATGSCGYQANPAKNDGKPDCPAGNPINSATGNKYQEETDYQGSGNFPLVFQRIYNSDSSVTGVAFNNGWRHSFEKSINVINSAAFVKIVREDGKSFDFYFNSNTNSGYPLKPGQNQPFAAHSCFLYHELMIKKQNDTRNPCD